MSLQGKIPLNPKDLRKEASYDFGDVRRSARQESFLEAFASNSKGSMPSLFTNRSELELAYRFINNKNISLKKSMSGHIDNTLKRGQCVEYISVLHDTTDVQFQIHHMSSIRKDLMEISSQKQGFMLHASLAVSNPKEGLPIPLGVLELTPFVHQKKIRNDKMEEFWSDQGGLYENEAQRWFDHLDTSQRLLQSSGAKIIHVMDRESDSYTLLSHMKKNDYEFVSRMQYYNRKTIHKKQTVSSEIQSKEFCGTFEVNIGFRSPFRNQKKLKSHPPRRARVATVSFRATSITIPQGSIQSPVFQEKHALLNSLTLNFVEVLELNPPEGETAVHWRIWTSLPTDSPEDIIFVAKTYYRRWMIEELFKALKTGCEFEKNQFQSAGAILRLLATKVIVAWWLLAVRAVMNGGKEYSWETILTPLAFLVLQRASPRAKLHKNSTNRQVLQAMASLGGHIKANGLPGWITLQRGLTVLYQQVLGARPFVNENNILIV